FDFVQKFLFAGSGLPQLIIHHGQRQLCFHIPIIPHFSPFCNCAVLPKEIIYISAITLKNHVDILFLM
ncbi:MAG: hypothetical protein MR836_07800, partial [Ruminococcus sp.]|nr:hypothetical protein [Ruminococcus sp.]